MSFEMKLYVGIGLILLAMTLFSAGLAFLLNWYLNREEKK